jgi:hypothetical protein
MLMHRYWYVECAEPSCKQRLTVQHVEFDDNDPAASPIIQIFPERFEFECKHCHLLHIYLRGELVSRISEQAPDPEFRNAFLPSRG